MHLGGNKIEGTERSRQNIHVIVWISWPLLLKSLSGGFATSFHLKAIENSVCKFHSEHATVTEESWKCRK